MLESAVLDLDVESRLGLTVKDLIGESVAVLGIKGSGKTNTAAVIIEELLPFLPMTIVDPEGEYWGLKERFEILVVGRSENADLPVPKANAAALAEFSVTQGVPVILDMDEFDQEEMAEFLLVYFEGLWKVATKARTPYQVVLEEAHEFVPQGTRTPLKRILTRIALRGRKRGLGVISISQRSAKVEKDVLTQAAISFLHRVVHPTDMSVYYDLVPLKKNDVDECVRRLAPGQVIALQNYDLRTVQMRLRHTFHAGATPGLNASAAPELRKIDAAMLDDLKMRLAAEDDTYIDPERARLLDDLAEYMRTNDELMQVIGDKEEQVAELKAEIERLRVQVDLLGNIKLSVEMPIAGGPPQIVEAGSGQNGKSLEPQVIRATTPVVKRQHQRFDILMRDVRELPKHQQRILAYLLDHEGAELSLEDLARFTGYSEGTVTSQPPLDLLKWGLLKRKGKWGDYRYTSAARATLTKMFPELEVEELVEQLLNLA